MILKVMPVGPIMANCFILGCEKTREAVVIDPGDEDERILMVLAEDQLTVKYIVNTHGHFDHVAANRPMKEATGADILIHEDDSFMLSELSAMGASFGLRVENSPPADKFLKEGDIISFGNIDMEILHTPGHSPGSVSIYIKSEKLLFSGDTLFAGSIGRTDLPGGNYKALISNVRNKIFSLDDDVKVYPGHGPETTILAEKRFNPFFQ
ncbi:MAG: MBL fold metallo-hydrolase [Deltaproteobacteria bacterium]|nr:MAG: MBL fold metallo-hydrolase [Deltaproteobacteria bacterium]